ncbi:MAG: hypothetical protein HYX21_02705 [Candidatus Yanofskybacteria bacterium]|nr:hypothetical protein [Candidatus Yanofskybacteria bacterium]
MGSQKGAKIGFASRVDYGSSGFRSGLVRAGFEIFVKEQVNFIVMPGGLVAKKALTEKMNAWIKERLSIRKSGGSKKNNGRTKLGKKKNGNGLSASEKLRIKKGELRAEFLSGVAKELAELIPVTTVTDPEDATKKKSLDLFITTSPAFDGEIGEDVAQLLAELRPDIKVWNVGGDRFPVLYVDKLIWALAPSKATWMRGDYFSTPVERVIKDKIKQTSQSSPDRFVVGCFGSSINKTKGELKYAYVSVPALSRLEETRVNENQIGVCVLEYPADNSDSLWRNYSLKDVVSRELDFIVPPTETSSLQKKMIDIMKTRGWATPGILRNALKDIPLDKIKAGMAELMKLKTFRRMGENWPGIVYKESGKKYYFDLDFIQHRLKYALPNGPFKEDRIVSFSCLHTGSIETDYDFFRNELPKIILKHNVDILVNVGDLIEGMKHFLDRKGEIIAGMNNYTIQEEAAANLVGAVMEEVFNIRFAKALAGETGEVTPDIVHSIVKQSLIDLKNKLGNHDLWQIDDGHTPLRVFELTIVNYLADKITETLAKKKLSCSDLRGIVESKIIRSDLFELPSGLKVSVQHPHMARAKTTSLRPQEMLEFAKRQGCQVAIGGNFHVSENIEEWDMDLGQCVCQELGTLKHGSNFERNKMKMVDQGVGVLRVLSKDKRIIVTESVFYGQPQPTSPISNIKIVNEILQKMKVDPIK